MIKFGVNENDVDMTIAYLKNIGLITSDANAVEYIKYTLRHRQAYIHTMLALGLMSSIDEFDLKHDIDKVVTYNLLPKSEASQLHRKYSIHHFPNTVSKRDKLRAVIDYECARLTKSDKPLNAYETILKYNPEHYADFEEILIELGINSSTHREIVVNLCPEVYGSYMAKLYDSGIEGIVQMKNLMHENNVENTVRLINKR